MRKRKKKTASGVCSCFSAVSGGNRLSWWSVKGEEAGGVICRLLLCIRRSFPLRVTPPSPPPLLGCVSPEAEKALGESTQAGP